MSIEKSADEFNFWERHRLLNLIMSLVLLVVMLLILWGIFKLIGIGISTIAEWFSKLTSKFDAVIIVALITGAVSIVGVVLSSIVSKRIDYKKSRQSYLAQKREKSYSEFVSMMYKVMQNSKKPNSYTEEGMLKDMLSFSQELTLWGSKKVAYKWVQFRVSGN